MWVHTGMVVDMAADVVRREELDQPSGTLELDARPSDAIALALAVRAPIYAERRVLEAAGFVPPTPEATAEEK